MTPITDIQFLASLYAEDAQKYLLFSLNAHSWDAQRGYMAEACRQQEVSARLYQKARIRMGLEG